MNGNSPLHCPSLSLSSPFPLASSEIDQLTLELTMANSTELLHAVSENSVIFEFVVSGLLLIGVGLLGLIGNLLAMVVLSRPQMKSSINCILIGLATVDSILIVTSILLFGLPSVHGFCRELFSTYFNHVFPFITPVVYPVGMIAQTCSAYLTLCVTMERYVAVCLPLRSRALCTYGRACGYVVAIITVATLYNLPRFWEVTWRTSFVPQLNASVTEVVSTALREDALYINVYITWLYLVVMYVVPFVSLAVFNLLIYEAVRKANSERARLSRLQQKEIGLATMLMIVVLVFFICNALALVVNVLEVMAINITALNNVSNLLITFNSSVNLLIYCIFGGKFQRIFFQLFCPCCTPCTRRQEQFVQRYRPSHTVGLHQENHTVLSSPNMDVGEHVALRSQTMVQSNRSGKHVHPHRMHSLRTRSNEEASPGNSQGKETRMSNVVVAEAQLANNVAETSFC